MLATRMLIAGLLGLTGCTHSDGAPGKFRTEFDHIGGADGVEIPQSICQLAADSSEAGIYKVTALTGYYEKVPGSSDHNGFTYVEMTLQTPWSPQAQPAVRARILGGPLAGGAYTPTFVTTHVGERIGALLIKPTAQNRNFPDLDPQDVFHFDASGNVSNGILTATPAQIKAVAWSVLSGNGCTDDIVPPSPSASAPPAGETDRGPGVLDAGGPDAGAVDAGS